ncbi:MAG: 2-phosphosulfolactate phosphatase [Verrucomicrobiales bacterium]|nr:2-phosphosulfolactate phosphatase [Verrucomicrobiales bacterium]
MVIDVLHAPAEYAALVAQDLPDRVCVVFDVLRATSTLVTALALGAASVRAVASIEQALKERSRDPDCLLAGERGGLRIGADQAGGVAFDLGNSPRELTRERVFGRRIVMTTTNGTLALQACARAKVVVAGAFLNLDAVAAHLQSMPDARVLLIGSGTGPEAAWEDSIAAGALCDRLAGPGTELGDAAMLAMAAWRGVGADLAGALGRGRNGRRLLAHPDLRDDVAWCAKRGCWSVVPTLDGTGAFIS